MHFEMTIEDLKTRGGVLDTIIDTAFDAVIIVDQNGIVLHSSKGSSQFSKDPIEMRNGKHITCYDTSSPFEKVLNTGRGETNIISIIQGRKCLASVIPVVSQGEVIGAIGTIMHSNLNRLSKLIMRVGPDMKSSIPDMQDVISRVQRNYTFDDYIGESRLVREMIEECRNAAVTSHPILLIGETGTGKEILASAIHSQNLKKDFSPYVKINCTAIPNDLLESELFGHQKGAFTGAIASKKGKFEVASGGSILLDEIGDMSLHLQSKLLRVLEEKEFERVGGVDVIPLRARMIASTNCNLRERCRQGKFREDLYYRLNVVEIKIPPLRKRKEDIPLLISHFIERSGIFMKISEEALETLIEYHWPGNVRELRNVINRLSIAKADKSVQATDVKKILNDEDEISSTSFTESHVLVPASTPSELSLAEREKQILLDALKQHHYNLSSTARLLGISRPALYNKIKKYKITLERTAQAKD